MHIQNLLWGGVKGGYFGHYNKQNNFLTYWKGDPYGHYKIGVPYEPDLPPDTPVSPCDLCPDGYDCVNGECVKPADPSTPGSSSTIIKPQIVAYGESIAEDTTTTREVECLTKRIIMNGYTQTPNGYITGVDEASGVRFHISPECYKGVVVEGRLNDASDPDNLLWYGTDHSLKVLTGESGITGDTKVRITISAENYDYIIERKRPLNDKETTDWEVFQSGTIDNTEKGDWLVVGVKGIAQIFTTSAIETSGLVPVSTDTTNIALPPSAVDGNYSSNNIETAGTTIDSNGNPVRTKSFFYFKDGEYSSYNKAIYEDGKLKVGAGAYNVTFGTNEIRGDDNDTCNTFWDVIFTPDVSDGGKPAIAIETMGYQSGGGIFVENYYTYCAVIVQNGNIGFDSGGYTIPIKSGVKYRMVVEIKYLDESRNEVQATLYESNGDSRTDILSTFKEYEYSSIFDSSSGRQWSSSASVAVMTSNGGNIEIEYCATSQASCTVNDVLFEGENGTIIHNIGAGTITFTSTSGGSITIADKNVGATECYHPGDTLSESNCGGYYQWGNNYMFPFSGDITTSSNQVDASGYGPGNYYYSDVFITGSSWDSSNNNNLWGDTTNTDEARQGPAPSGYHIPTDNEVSNLWSLVQSITGATTGNELSQYCLLPFAGYRNRYDATADFQATYGDYWTSSPDSTNARYWGFNGSYVNFNNNSSRASGFSVRCFKNSYGS